MTGVQTCALPIFVILLTVALTVLLICACFEEDGMEAVYPLGSLLEDAPEKLRILLNFLSVNGGI